LSSRYRDQIAALAQLGVRLVVTLTEEEPLPPAWFAGLGVGNLFVAVPNYEPPSVEQMDLIIAAVEGTIRLAGVQRFSTLFWTVQSFTVTCSL
jgi:hypothetical protein